MSGRSTHTRRPVTVAAGSIRRRDLPAFVQQQHGRTASVAAAAAAAASSVDAKSADADGIIVDTHTVRAGAQRTRQQPADTQDARALAASIAASAAAATATPAPAMPFMPLDDDSRSGSGDTAALRSVIGKSVGGAPAFSLSSSSHVAASGTRVSLPRPFPHRDCMPRNIVQQLMARQTGAGPQGRTSFSRSTYAHRFGRLRLVREIDTRITSTNAADIEVMLQQQPSKVTEIVAANNILFALTHAGICSAFDNSQRHTSTHGSKCYLTHMSL